MGIYGCASGAVPPRGPTTVARKLHWLLRAPVGTDGPQRGHHRLVSPQGGQPTLCRGVAEAEGVRSGLDGPRGHVNPEQVRIPTASTHGCYRGILARVSLISVGGRDGPQDLQPGLLILNEMGLGDSEVVPA